MNPPINKEDEEKKQQNPQKVERFIKTNAIKSSVTILRNDVNEMIFRT